MGFSGRGGSPFGNARAAEVVSRSVIKNQCPVCLAVYGDRKAAHRHLLHRFVVGPVVIDHVILVKCTSHCLSVAQFAQPNLEIGQNSNSASLNICETFSKMTDFEMPSWGKRKPEEAPQGQGRRAVRQAVAEGRNDRDVTRRLVDVLATDSHRVQDVSGSRLGERGRSNGRGGSTLPRIRWRNQEQARSRARRRPRATRSPVRACVVWRRRGSWHQNTLRC